MVENLYRKTETLHKSSLVLPSIEVLCNLLTSKAPLVNVVLYRGLISQTLKIGAPFAQNRVLAA